MEKLTYRQAYDKIIDAYFRDEIKPMDAKFCFCGTLSPVKGHWVKGLFKPEEHFYTFPEYKAMEWALMHTIGSICGSNKNPTEDALFSGMTAALEVLKQIHIDRGEIIDEVRGLVKREIRTITK